MALTLLVAPIAQAVEILRWERLPLTVPLVVGQERIVFIDRNVRVGVPSTVGERLRVQSAGGAVYLRANAPIEPSRLQLQDLDSGALILLDIVAEPAREDDTPLEPVRIVEP
jgi:integrating conjugative element protein (TIGR03749 family)